MGWGDDLMVSGAARHLHAAGGGKVEMYRPLSVSHSGSPLWRGLEYIAQPGEHPASIIVDTPTGRPYRASIDAFKSTWREFAPVSPEIRFSAAELDFAQRLGSGFVVVEPHVKAHRHGADNKRWGWEYNKQLVAQLKSIRWVQLARPGTAPLPDVTYVPTTSFRQACAILARARAFVGPEGGLHHASAAVGVPAVVIFGGYISPKVTGYQQHTNIFTGENLGCGMHIKCMCNCMHRISVSEVAEAVLTRLRTY